MGLCAYVVWFGVFSVVGWVVECVFTSIQSGEWENRGFLFGPVCPIYGSGVVAILALYSAMVAHMGGSVDDVRPWQVFVASMAGSAVLEYVTSFVLEYFFHARWWDYGNVPLNLNGRVCLPFACMFGVAGVVLFYFVAEPVTSLSAHVPHLAWEIMSMLTVGLMSADLGLTISALGDLAKKLESAQADFDAIMEVAVSDLVNGRVPLTSGKAQLPQLPALPAEADAAIARMLGGLNHFQKHSVRHIRSFSSQGSAVVARHLRAAMERARKVARHGSK